MSNLRENAYELVSAWSAYKDVLSAAAFVNQLELAIEKDKVQHACINLQYTLFSDEDEIKQALTTMETALNIYTEKLIIEIIKNGHTLHA